MKKNHNKKLYYKNEKQKKREFKWSYPIAPNHSIVLNGDFKAMSEKLKTASAKEVQGTMIKREKVDLRDQLAVVKIVAMGTP